MTSEVSRLLGAQTWQVAAVAAAVGLLARFVGRKHPHLTYVLWLVVLVKCLTPPLWASPLGAFSWALAERPFAGAAAPDDYYAFTPLVPETPAPAWPAPADSASSGPRPKSAPVGSPPRRAGGWSWPSPATLVAGTWLAGVAALAGYWLVVYLRTRRRFLRASRPCTEPRLLALCDELRRRLGLRRRVRLLEADELLGPASFGVARPTVVLPRPLVEQLDPGHLEWVLAHELIHLRRGDPFHAVLQLAALCLGWFHPLVWWSHRQLNRVRETCCDEELVAALGCDPAEYAGCLLDILKRLRDLRAGRAYPGVSWIRPLDVTRERLETLMQTDRTPRQRTPWRYWLLGLALGCTLWPGAGQVLRGLAGTAPAEDRTGALTPRAADVRADLDQPSGAELSPDGKHLYVASWNNATIVAFARDAATGGLTHRDTIKDERLDGVTKIHVSPDGRYLAASAFRAGKVLVFERHPDSGRLNLIDTADAVAEGVGKLEWPVDAVWSPDGKFVYVADSVGARDNDGNSTGQVAVFRVSAEGKLQGVESFPGQDRCFANVRALFCHADGSTLFAGASDSGALSVLFRDKESGKLTLRQVLKNDGDLKGLNGAMHMTCSPDGQFVYSTSGRFHGDHAVCAFKIGSDGMLKPVQSLLEGSPDLPAFQGGNKVAVSPDGKNVYATGTNSGHLVTFRRDPKTGKLSHLASLIPSVKGMPLPGANGLAVSPDGKHVYVTAEMGNAVLTLERK